MDRKEKILSVLSKREIEIVQELTQGKKDKQIAESLEISINTVKTHLKRIYLKLQVTGRVELIILLS